MLVNKADLIGLIVKRGECVYPQQHSTPARNRHLQYTHFRTRFCQQVMKHNEEDIGETFKPFLTQLSQDEGLPTNKTSFTTRILRILIWPFSALLQKRAQEYLLRRLGLANSSPLTLPSVRALVEEYTQSLETKIYEDRIAKLHGGFSLLHDAAKSTAKQGLLYQALGNFHEITKLPQSGKTVWRPNGELRSMAFVGMAASYILLQDRPELIAEKMAEAVYADRFTAESWFGKELVHTILASIEQTASGEAPRRKEATLPFTIFYSYAAEDEALRNELEKHLSMLHRQNYITSWYPRKITAGAEVNHEIEAHLNSAQFILLLVSPDYLASDYIYNKEMKQALERHEREDANVIPILLRPVDWENAPFSKLQVLPAQGKPITSWSNRDEAFQDVAEGIKTSIKEYLSRLANLHL